MKRFALGCLCAACLSLSFSSCHSVIDETQEEINRFAFREPLTDWSASVEEVKDYMTGYTVLSASDCSLAYEGKGSEGSYLYAFSGLSHQLSYSVVTFNASMESEAILFLENNYIRLGSQDGAYVFSDENSNTVITVSSDQSDLRLTYMSRAYMAR